MQIRDLTEEHFRNAVTEGEFGPEVIESAGLVAVVMTQGWCPQWPPVRSYLTAMSGEDGQDGLVVFIVEYDTKTWGNDFMAFKEKTFGNSRIPYIRYYRDGRLVSESNYISREGFLESFGSETS